LRSLADSGAEAAIVGTALYENRLTLADALAVTC
jgi:phosphoribosylformimino-5-aminoimidazole carboxamide ribonucleotide (ProFAR) isomerase